MKELDQEKQEILKQFVELTKKLAKVPTARQFNKFTNVSERKLYNNFLTYGELKDKALELYPFLQDLIVPPKLTTKDLENFRMDQEKKSIKKYNNSLTQKVSTLDFLEKFSEKIFDGRVKPVKPMETKNKIERAIFLTLSDLHFGSDTNGKETGFLTYGKKEEARRFAEVIKQTVDYKPQYRKQTELHVNLLGDIIQHKLHDSQDGAAVSEQICRAIHLLIQGLSHLAENFPKVYIHCATGNHGRDLNRHRERATSGKWDSLETVLYYSIKKSLKNYKNVIFDIPKTPFVIYEVLGHKVFATHGDTVLNPGNPGKNINIAKLETQINKINASLKDTEEIKLVFVGHTHCASVSHLNTGAALITNGCLVPIDPFAVSLGILENQASQTLTETTRTYALGDIRFIQIGKEQDENDKLEEIIQPWKGFNDE